MDHDLQFARQVTNHRSTSSVGMHCSGYSVWPGTGTPYGGAAGGPVPRLSVPHCFLTVQLINHAVESARKKSEQICISIMCAYYETKPLGDPPFISAQLRNVHSSHLFVKIRNLVHRSAIMSHRLISKCNVSAVYTLPYGTTDRSGPRPAHCRAYRSH